MCVMLTKLMLFLKDDSGATAIEFSTALSTAVSGG
jgi:Flp pilus assembly pilin Flp